MASGKVSEGRFELFRKCGKVSDEKPFTVFNIRQKNYLAVPISNSFAVLDLDSLSMQLNGPFFDSGITHVYYFDESFIVLTDKSLYKCQRDDVEYSKPLNNAVVSSILHNSSLFILSKKFLQRFNLISFEYDLCVNILFPEPLCVTLSLENSIYVFYKNGYISIFDINTLKCKDSFEFFPGYISFVSLSYIPGLFAFISHDNVIGIFDLKSKQIIFETREISYPNILFFENTLKKFLIISTKSGLLLLWNLENSRIENSVFIPNNQILFLQQLNNEPIFIISSLNLIQIWALENNTFRLIKDRSGHFSSVQKIRFLTQNKLISAGKDGQIRLLSIMNDVKSTEFSQGHLEMLYKTQRHNNPKRLPTINDFIISDCVSRKWGDFYTCHVGSSSVFAWKLENHSIIDSKIRSSDSSEILSINASACYNYLIIGTSSGRIELFHLESGTLKNSLSARNGPITSLFFNTVGDKIFCFTTSGSLIKIDYMNFKILEITNLFNCGIKRAEKFAFKDFAILNLSNCTLALIDLERSAAVRNYIGHEHQITDFAFSSDIQLLFSSSLDKNIKIWSIESAIVLAEIKLPFTPLSICLSPNFEFVAISFSEEPEIHIYYDSYFYKSDDDFRLCCIEEKTNYKSTTDEIIFSKISLSKWLKMINPDAVKDFSKPLLVKDKDLRLPFFLEQDLANDTNLNNKVNKEKKLILIENSSSHNISEKIAIYRKELEELMLLFDDVHFDTLVAKINSIFKILFDETDQVKNELRECIQKILMKMTKKWQHLEKEMFLARGFMRFYAY